MKDGAIWFAFRGQGGSVTLRLAKLGRFHMTEGPLTARVASAFLPDINNDLPEWEKVPDVDCQHGYRQLCWNEVIENGDEFFDSEAERWQPAGDIGARYRPMHAHPIDRKHALTRRQYT